ncbi:MAG: hypothetical protein AAGD13_00795 [Pseudomonadota bacterium]
MKIIGIDPTVKGYLDIGDEVIEQVKKLVPHGAGNQVDDVKRTSGHADRLTGMAQRLVGPDWHRPMRNAAATIKYGSGNCQDQAAVAYLCLRDRLPSAANVSYCVAWATKHSFATIGNPETDSEDQVVVVDPWPIHPQAVRWKEHFCRGDNRLEVKRSKSGKADGPSKVERCKTKHFATTHYEQELIFVTDHPASPTWNHQWCAAAKEKIVYSTDLIDFG